MQGHLINRFATIHCPKSHLFNHRFSDLSLHQRLSLHKQTIYERLNLPPKPKRPLLPYIKFLNQVRPVLVKEFPEFKSSAKDIVKIAAQRWKILDSNVKEKLTEQYKNEYMDYSKFMNEYEEKLSPDQKAEIKKAIRDDLNIKEERKAKKKSKELGKPKQPLSSFLRYLGSRSTELPKYSSRTEWVKAISQEWKTISPEMKAKFEEESARDFSKWKEELSQWEKKMIKEGNLELVRTSSLVPVPKKKFKK